MDDDSRPFSYFGSVVSLICQAVIEPNFWQSASKLAMSLAGAFVVGVLVPIAQRAIKDAIEAYYKERCTESQRDAEHDRADAAEKELADLRSGRTLLTPPDRAP